MSAKNSFSFSSNDQHKNGVTSDGENKYNNLNLNQNFKLSEINPVQSTSVTNKKQDASDSDSLANPCIKDQLFVGKDVKSNGYLLDFAVEKEMDQKQLKPHSSLANHILNYENSAEVFVSPLISSTKKSITDKELWSLSSAITSSFEFARQQDNDENKTPEVSHFQASQILMNPNQSSKLGSMDSKPEEISTAVEAELEVDEQNMPKNHQIRAAFNPQEEAELQRVGQKLKASKLKQIIEKNTCYFNYGEPQKNDFIGTFKVLAKLGSGSAGSVYLVEWNGLHFALKYSTTMGILEHEYSMAKRCSTAAHILPAVYYANNGIFEIMLMPLAGRSLFEFLNEKRNDGEIKTEEAFKECCFYFSKCFKSLEELHMRGILHQDIKLQNFVIGMANPTDVFLIDFSNARNVVSGICVQKLRGTVPFDSRAQLTQDVPQTFKSDLESLLYCMVDCLEGLPLFKGNNLEVKKQIFTDQKMKSVFLKNLPSQFHEIMDFIEQHQPESPTNYTRIIELLDDIATDENKFGKTVIDRKVATSPESDESSNQSLSIQDTQNPSNDAELSSVKPRPVKVSPSTAQQHPNIQIPHSLKPQNSPKSAPSPDEFFSIEHDKEASNVPEISAVPPQPVKLSPPAAKSHSNLQIPHPMKPENTPKEEKIESPPPSNIAATAQNAVPHSNSNDVVYKWRINKSGNLSVIKGNLKFEKRPHTKQSDEGKMIRFICPMCRRFHFSILKTDYDGAIVKLAVDSGAIVGQPAPVILEESDAQHYCKPNITSTQRKQ